MRISERLNNNNDKIEISDGHSSQWLFNFLWTLNALGNSFISTKLSYALIHGFNHIIFRFQNIFLLTEIYLFHPMK